MQDLTQQQAFFDKLDPKIITIRKHELQYDFFLDENETEVDRLIRMTEEIKTSTSAVRRKLFADQAPLKKKMLDLEQRLQILESAICKGELVYVEKENP
jgi:hypothetical protein